MYSAAPPPPLASPRPDQGRGWMVVAAVLTVVFAVAAAGLGLVRWARPVWSPSSGWMIEHVPGPLTVLVVGTAAVCVAVAFMVPVRVAGLHAREPLTWAWAALLLLAAAALVWDALYSAALSTIDFGAVIPIFHWLFTFLPAVLAGWLFMRRPRQERRTAALSTGLVTVPLLTLSFALLDAKGPAVAGMVGALILTAVLGIAPLIGGVAVAGAIGGRDQFE